MGFSKQDLSRRIKAAVAEVAEEEEDPYAVPGEDCEGGHDGCAACWGCEDRHVLR